MWLEKLLLTRLRRRRTIPSDVSAPTVRGGLAPGAAVGSFYTNTRPESASPYGRRAGRAGIRVAYAGGVLLPASTYALYLPYGQMTIFSNQAQRGQMSASLYGKSGGWLKWRLRPTIGFLSQPSNILTQILYLRYICYFGDILQLCTKIPPDSQGASFMMHVFCDVPMLESLRNPLQISLI